MGTLLENKWQPVFEKFLRFSGAGLIGTIAHYVLLVLLVEIFTAPPVFASTCGAVLGAFINYLLNYHFTFKSSKRHVETVPKFLIVAIFGWVFNGLVVYALVTMSLNYILAQLIATGVVLIWGFVANLLWTFVNPQRSDADFRRKKAS